MSEIGGIESLGIEGGEQGVDAAALERLREQMRENQKQAAKDTKKEAKKKQQELSLGDIIIALLKKEDAKGLLNVVIAALSAGIPASFILKILALRFKSIRQKLGINLGGEAESQKSQQAISSNKALVPNNFSNEALPLQVAIELDLWLKYLIADSKLIAAELLPKISYSTNKLDKYDREAKNEMKNLISYIVQDFLQAKNIPFNGQSIVVFSSKFSDSLVDYLEECIKKLGA